MTSTIEEDVLKDLMARRWTRLGEAPRGITHVRAAIVAWDESKAIITGGHNLENDEVKDSVFVYNKDTMETETLPSMLQARFRHAAVIVGGNLLFVIGGLGPGGITLNSIEVLDLNDPREWRLFPVKLGEARRCFSVVAVNEHEIYIIGGFDDHQILNSVWILNISTETISQGPPMLESRMIFAAALIGDSIVVTGGSHGRTLNTCEKLSIRVDSDEEAQWQPLHSNMNIARGHHHGLSFGDCMVVVGGNGHNTAGPTRMNEVWNGTTNTWTQLPARLPIGGAIYGFVKLGEDLVCFAGDDDPSVYCLFSAKGLLEHQRRQIRFNELIADERTEVVIPLLLEGLGQRGWISLFYECIRETNGRLIPQRRRPALGNEAARGG